MSIAQSFAQELQQEAAITRRYLERLPEEKWDWKPHEKSMDLGRLASHLVEIPGWGEISVNQDVFDMNTEDYQPYRGKNREELVRDFDAKIAECLQALDGKSDEQLMSGWKMRVNGEEKFSMPKLAVVRGFILNHLVHHRGQLSVYLRLCGTPVPATYGPSADEGQM